MLRSTSILRGYTIRTQDGDAGRVADFYFDDLTWTLRYLIADTRAWLPGKKVLISPAALGTPDWKLGVFPINLSRHQLEHGPEIENNRPVSRQKEEELAQYFHWPAYWSDSGLSGFPTPQALQARGTSQVMERGDAHLQSARELIGYRLAAKDGELGRIADFILDDEVWALRYAVVSTSSWLPGRRVLMATDWIKDVRWERSSAKTFLTREQIENSPIYDPLAVLNRDYEEVLYRHYQLPGYWKRRQ